VRIMVRIFRWPLRESEREMLSAILMNGGVVVYPTDTIYGIGGIIYDRRVVDKIYKIKERLRDKGLPILFGSIEKIEEIAILNPLAKKLAQRFWPGMLTLVVPLKRRELRFLTGLEDKIAVRIPSDEIVLEVIKLAGGAIIGTSANLSGKLPCTNIKCVISQLDERMDAIVDGGKRGTGLPSTIVEIQDDKKIKIIREGSIEVEKIKEAIGLEFS